MSLETTSLSATIIVSLSLCNSLVSFSDCSLSCKCSHVLSSPCKQSFLSGQSLCCLCHITVIMLLIPTKAWFQFLFAPPVLAPSHSQACGAQHSCFTVLLTDVMVRFEIMFFHCSVSWSVIPCCCHCRRLLLTFLWWCWCCSHDVDVAVDIAPSCFLSLSWLCSLFLDLNLDLLLFHISQLAHFIPQSRHFPLLVGWRARERTRFTCFNVRYP